VPPDRKPPEEPNPRDDSRERVEYVSQGLDWLQEQFEEPEAEPEQAGRDPAAPPPSGRPWAGGSWNDEPVLPVTPAPGPPPVVPPVGSVPAARPPRDEADAGGPETREFTPIEVDEAVRPLPTGPAPSGGRTDAPGGRPGQAPRPEPAGVNDAPVPLEAKIAAARARQRARSAATGPPKGGPAPTPPAPASAGSPTVPGGSIWFRPPDGAAAGGKGEPGEPSAATAEEADEAEGGATTDATQAAAGKGGTPAATKPGASGVGSGKSAVKPGSPTSPDRSKPASGKAAAAASGMGKGAGPSRPGTADTARAATGKTSGAAPATGPDKPAAGKGGPQGQSGQQRQGQGQRPSGQSQRSDARPSAAGKPSGPAGRAPAGGTAPGGPPAAGPLTPATGAGGAGGAASGSGAAGAAGAGGAGGAAKGAGSATTKPAGSPGGAAGGGTAKPAGPPGAGAAGASVAKGAGAAGAPAAGAAKAAGAAAGTAAGKPSPTAPKRPTPKVPVQPPLAATGRLGPPKPPAKSQASAGTEAEPAPTVAPGTTPAPTGENGTAPDTPARTVSEASAREVPLGPLGERQPGSASGWQALLARLTGGRVRTGVSDAQRHELEERIAAPVSGCRRIAMVALKGGVGKTTTTACLGAVLAEHRQDRIVAVDANPDAGTLGYRIRLETTRTAKDLLANADKLEGYADMRANASQTSFRRLEVIASDVDPTVDEAFGEQDYHDVSAVLERFYGIVLTDCGPGLLHSAMRSVLPTADQLVVISAASLDGSRAASLTLDWLEQHEYGDLARNSVVVINAVRPRTLVDIDQLQQHFVRRCRSVVQVPFDRHLETGAEIVFKELAPATRQAYLELAASVVDGVSRGRG
jgi:MinD-like ATPase involved in chromosome partitioning or flagellar assembly